MPNGVITATYSWYFPTMQSAIGVMPMVTMFSEMFVMRPAQEL